MIQTSISQAKSRLSALLRRVEGGETVLILRRGRPVARLVPVHPLEDQASEQRLAQLELHGIVRRAEGPPDPSLLSGEAPQMPEGASLLDALLQDRREGR